MNNSNVVTKAPRATYHNELLTHYLPVSVFFAIAALIGVIGNLIVVKFYGRKTQPKTSFTYLVRWLAWADFLVCVLLFVGAVEIGVNINFNFKYVCKASYFLFQWTINMSTWILGIISIDRYRKICQPFKSLMTMRFVRAAVKVILLPTFIMAVRNVITYDIVTADVTMPTKNGTFVVTGYYCGSTTDPDLQIYTTVFNLIDIVAGSSLLVIYSLAYGLITHALVAHRKSLQAWKEATPKSTIKNTNLGTANKAFKANDIDKPRGDSEIQSTSVIDATQNPVDVQDICLANKANSDDTENTVLSNEAVTHETNNDPEESPTSHACDHSATTTSESSDISNACRKSMDVKAKPKRDPDKPKKTLKRSEYQKTIMILWVTVVFMISLSSFFVGTLVFRHDPQSEQAVRPLTHFMIKCVFLNSVSNPIIYYIFNNSFKAFVKKVLMCKGCD